MRYLLLFLTFSFVLSSHAFTFPGVSGHLSTRVHSSFEIGLIMSCEDSTECGKKYVFTQVKEDGTFSLPQTSWHAWNPLVTSLAQVEIHSPKGTFISRPFYDGDELANIMREMTVIELPNLNFDLSQNLLLQSSLEQNGPLEYQVWLEPLGELNLFLPQELYQNGYYQSISLDENSDKGSISIKPVQRYLLLSQFVDPAADVGFQAVLRTAEKVWFQLSGPYTPETIEKLKDFPQQP